LFKDRIDAGQQLADALIKMDSYEKGIVVAIPRGGVVVGVQVARRLDLPIDIIIPRKVGAPHNPEVAIGAVTQDGTAIFNEDLLQRLELSKKDIKPVVEAVIKEINRRMITYRGDSQPADLAGRSVILVDDGIATGSTVVAALRSLKNTGCKRITLAVPVAPPDTVDRLKKEVAELVCLRSEEPFYAVGQFYEDFSQTSDDEVISLLKGHRSYLKEYVETEK